MFRYAKKCMFREGFWQLLKYPKTPHLHIFYSDILRGIYLSKTFHLNEVTRCSAISICLQLELMHFLHRVSQMVAI
jgi:hypothetical protein